MSALNIGRGVAVGVASAILADGWISIVLCIALIVAFIISDEIAEKRAREIMHASFRGRL